MTPTACLKATGNAFPTAMAAQVLIPIMGSLADANAIREPADNLTQDALSRLVGVARQMQMEASQSSSGSSDPNPVKRLRRL